MYKVKSIILAVILVFALVIYGLNVRSNEPSNIDDIIKFYDLHIEIECLEASIDTLNAKCLCMEQRINVLEKVVKDELQNKNRR